MEYYKDLSQIDLSDYKDLLLNMELIKSRELLRNDIIHNFQLLKEMKIENVKQLQNALKSKSKLEQFSNESKIDIEYLKILLREINSLLPKPNKFSDFSLLDLSVIKNLEEAGYKDTNSIFTRIINDRENLVRDLKFDEDSLNLIISYVDISRIRWVNHTFAGILILIGYDSADKIARANVDELYTQLITRNKVDNIYNANIGLHDIKILIQWASWVVKNLN